jgi:hypothetical protein
MAGHRIIGAVGVFGLLVAAASADVVIGNLPAAIRDSSALGDPQYWAAQSFRTDATTYTLDSVSLMSGMATPDTGVIVELHADGANGEVGGALVGFFVPDLTGALAANTFVPEVSFVLERNTNYWIVAGVVGPGQAFWSYSDTKDANLFVGPGCVRGPNAFADSSDAGATWTYYELGAFAGSGAYIFEVNGTPDRTACGPADIAEPIGLLDLADITAFVTAFVAEVDVADLAPPCLVFDLSDVTTFVASFLAGCP